MTWTLDDRPLRSVLATRLRYLGDIAMSTVVLRVLRDGDPGLRLGYLCEEAHAPLLAGHPLVDRLHVLASRRRGADARARAGSAKTGVEAGTGTLGTAWELRRAGYDLAVDLFFNPRSAWLLKLAGVRSRIGGARGSRGRLYTHLATPPGAADDPGFRRLAPGGLGDHLSRLFPLRHGPRGIPFRDWFVDRYAGETLRTEAVPPPAGEAVTAALAAAGVGAGQPYVLLCPGATWPTKEWPAAHWGELARMLGEKLGLPMVMLAPPGGAGAYAAALGNPSAGGGALDPLPLADALATVAGADLVISVDGGVMHAAVAYGRPTVALFGPTSPEIWFPYRGRGSFRVLCARPPCHPCDRLRCDDFVCLPSLDPRTVAEAACALVPAGSQGGAR